MTYSDEKILEAVELMRSGMSIERVVWATGMSRTTILRYANGAPLPKRTRKQVKVTEREKQVLAYVLAYEEKRGLPPTYKEIAFAFGISRQRVGQITRNLKEKGFLTYEPHTKRGLKVTLKERDR